MVFCSTYKLVSLLRIFTPLSHIVTMFEHVIGELLGYFFFYVLFVFMLAQMLAISDADMDVQKYEDLGIGHFSQFMVNSMRITMKNFDAGAEGIDQLSHGDLDITLSLRSLACIFAGIVFTRLLIGEIMKTHKTIIATIDIHIERQRFSMVREAQKVLGRNTGNQNWFPRVIIVRQ